MQVEQVIGADTAEYRLIEKGTWAGNYSKGNATYLITLTHHGRGKCWRYGSRG